MTNVQVYIELFDIHQHHDRFVASASDSMRRRVSTTSMTCLPHHPTLHHLATAKLTTRCDNGDIHQPRQGSMSCARTQLESRLVHSCMYSTYCTYICRREVVCSHGKITMCRPTGDQLREEKRANLDAWKASHLSGQENDRQESHFRPSIRTPICSLAATVGRAGHHVDILSPVDHG